MEGQGHQAMTEISRNTIKLIIKIGCGRCISMPMVNVSLCLWSMYLYAYGQCISMPMPMVNVRGIGQIVHMSKRTQSIHQTFEQIVFKSKRSHVKWAQCQLFTKDMKLLKLTLPNSQ